MILFYLSLIEDINDKDKFEKLYILYRKKMFYVANEILNNQYDAEDAVHNAFISIARNMSSIDDIHSSETYAYVITASKNMALNIISKKSKEHTIPFDESVWNIEDENALQKICRIENQSLIVECLKRLSPLYLEVLYAYYVNEMTEKEIAKSYNRKPATVRKQIERGKKLLLNSLLKEKDLLEFN